MSVMYMHRHSKYIETRSIAANYHKDSTLPIARLEIKSSDFFTPFHPIQFLENMLFKIYVT